MRKLLTNQKITSDGGWHVVRHANHTNAYNWTGRDPEYLKIKQWCRDNCTGTYGYSKVSLHLGPYVKSFAHITDGHNQSVSYFVFKDEIDVFALKLLSYDIEHAPMWPSETKFTMFVGDK